MTAPLFLPPTVAIHHGNGRASDTVATGYHLTASTEKHITGCDCKGNTHTVRNYYACDDCAAATCWCLLEAMDDASELATRHDCEVTITRVADGKVLAHTRPYRKARAA